MLEACCACGRLRRLITPDHPLLLGSVAVTFEESAGAHECFVKLNRRWFDSRQLSVRLFHCPPRDHSMQSQAHSMPLVEQHCLPSDQHLNGKGHLTAADLVEPHLPTSTKMTAAEENLALSSFLSSMQESYGDVSDDAAPVDSVPEATASAAQDTEDFLNSLL